MANTIVGLEITEEGVRAAEVTVGRSPRLVAFGSVPIPAGAAKDSEIFDKDAVVLALRQLWTRAGIKGRNVVLGIGSRRILVRDYTTQAMRPDLLAQALPYQVQDLLPVPADQAVLDFYPVSQDGDQVSGLLVAAVAETVEELVATVGKAKVTVDVVDLAPFALARATARVAAADQSVAALYLGDHTSYVVVVHNGVPRFVRIIPVEITTGAVLAREGAATPADIEKPAPSFDDLLETVPPTPNDQTPLRRRSATRAGLARPSGMTDSAIDGLVTRLGSTLRFYADRAPEYPVTRILITGPGAVVEGVSQALAASLPMPVEVLGVSAIFQFKGNLEPADDVSILTTAGLALGEAR